MRRSLLAIVVVLLGVPWDLAAQVIVSLPPGSRVRVSMVDGHPDPTSQRQVGTLVSLSEASVVIQNGSGTQETYAIASVETLEVSMERRSRMGRGALIGGLGLGAVGAVSSYIEESRCEPQLLFGVPSGGCGSPAGFAVLGFVVSGAVGAGVGALIGSAIRTDRWQTVPRGARTAMASVRGGIALSFSVSH